MGFGSARCQCFVKYDYDDTRGAWFTFSGTVNELQHIIDTLYAKHHVHRMSISYGEDAGEVERTHQ